MAAQVFLEVVLPNDVILDASIFDDRNYVEIDERFLSQAQEQISRHPQRESTRLIAEIN